MNDEQRRREAGKRAEALMDELHRAFGEHTKEDERELQAILGDSPDELDLMPVPKEKRLRPESASTPTR